MRVPNLSRLLRGVFAVVIMLASGRALADVNVTQHHNNSSRDGVYVDAAFTSTLVSGLKRDTNFDGRINGNVYAQPLYIEGGPGGRAMVIAVTESNYVFALDALSGVTIWQTNVGPPVPAGVLPCGNVEPVGILGTPAVDLPSRALFFDAMIRTPAPKHFLYSLNVDTGALNPGWPVAVDGAAKFGNIVFNSLAQGQRGALALVGTNLYVPFGGISGDCGTYYGWVVGVPLTNPTNIMAWATTARGGGAWAVGGIASDGTNAFVATGNTFSTGGVWGGGEAILRLSQTLALANGTMDYWSPTNWLDLDNTDTDVGGSGPVLLDVPGATPSKLVAAFGKDGNAYLLNRTNLGGISQPLAQMHVVRGTIIQASATYRTAQGTYLVLSAIGNLYSLRVGASSPPTLQLAWSKSQNNGRGSPFVTSTDGTNNVIVWVVSSEGDQRLHAFDGDTGADVFTGGGASELMAGTHRFNTAIAARGRIYAANDDRVYAFLVPGQPVAPIQLGSLAISPGGGFQFAFDNVSGTNFSVFSTTNLSTPLTNWVRLGNVPEVAPGHYQFSDETQDPTLSHFYRVSSP
ncbi:MAG: hypothetical protein ACREIC_20490 [Limisphaerales bacterium]